MCVWNECVWKIASLMGQGAAIVDVCVCVCVAGTPKLFCGGPVGVAQQHRMDTVVCCWSSGLLRLPHPAPRRDDRAPLLPQLLCFDLFLLLNYKGSRGRRPSLHHKAGIMFLNEEEGGGPSPHPHSAATSLIVTFPEHLSSPRLFTCP